MQAYMRETKKPNNSITKLPVYIQLMPIATHSLYIYKFEP